MKENDFLFYLSKTKCRICFSLQMVTVCLSKQGESVPETGKDAGSEKVCLTEKYLMLSLIALDILLP